ncbi:hypothetical protein [Mesorhizobium sp. L103C131B0]|uniref:hypothetical protein n=1 Tax=Mesorhizobium sp. L103C131B0 TaxID=1287089 RepID=UPI0003D04113|nr:hypothetical protein [Mesorhizobium sp. L103C131B0]ESZ53669.1 hypothetical protein X729_30960 [Mesorhizobium sp. L103C131B0]
MLGAGGPIKVGRVGAVKFDDRSREYTEGMPDLAEIFDPLLDATSCASALALCAASF